MASLQRRWVCRGYEMDARHRVSPGALARYMEQLRWEAIDERRFGLADLFSSGNKLVVRAQDLWIGAPAVHGTELDLSISLARVGNSSLVFAETATRVSDGAEVARAYVTGVVLGPNNRPTPVPEGMRAEMQTCALPAPISFEREVSQGYQRSVGVRPSDLDTLLHVNQSRYVDFVDDTRTLMHAASAAAGVALAYPSRIVVDYRRETHLGRDLTAHACALDDAPGALAVDLRDALDAQLVARARILGGP